MSVHGLFSSCEGQQEIVANGRYSSAFIGDTLRFVRLDPGARARFMSSKKFTWIQMFYFFCMPRPFKAFPVQNKSDYSVI